MFSLINSRFKSLPLYHLLVATIFLNSVTAQIFGGLRWPWARNTPAQPTLNPLILQHMFQLNQEPNHVEVFLNSLPDAASLIRQMNARNAKSETSLHFLAQSPKALEYLQLIQNACARLDPNHRGQSILAQVKYSASHNGRFYPLFYTINNPEMLQVFQTLIAFFARLKCNTAELYERQLNDQWAVRIYDSQANNAAARSRYVRK